MNIFLRPRLKQSATQRLYLFVIPMLFIAFLDFFFMFSDV